MSLVIDVARFRAVVFDLDGVLPTRRRCTKWHGNTCSTKRSESSKEPWIGGRSMANYRRYVDGRSRVDGIETLLASRGARLPRGRPDDQPGATTAWALANRKNEYFLAALTTEGVRAFPSSVPLVRRLRAEGLGTAVVTASQNRSEVLTAAGMVKDVITSRTDQFQSGR